MPVNFIPNILGPSNQLPFAPAKKGFGVYTRPAQNATIYRVTNLNKSGAGSLEEAVNATGNRVVLFDVAGLIDYGATDFVMGNGNLHIAGQTAPYPGITIKAPKSILKASNVIIEHVRFMSTDEHTNSNINSSLGYDSRDSLVIIGSPSAISNVVLNHVTNTFGVDGSLDIVRDVNNVSVMSSIVALNLKYSIHARDGGTWSKLDQHSLLMLIDHFVDKVDITRCMIGFSDDRVPRCGAKNLFYAENLNPNTQRDRFVDLFTRNSSGANTSINANVVGNRFITDRSSQNVYRVKGDSGFSINLYQSNNDLVLNNNNSPISPNSGNINRDGDNGSFSYRSNIISSAIPHGWSIPQNAIDEATIHNQVGAWPAFRMPLESEIIENAKNRTGERINSFSEVGNPRFNTVLASNSYKSGDDKPTIANRKQLTNKGWPNWRNWLLSTSPMGRKNHVITNPNSVTSGGYTRLEAYLHACSRYVELGEGGQDESFIDEHGRGWTK